MLDDRGPGHRGGDLHRQVVGGRAESAGCQDQARPARNRIAPDLFQQAGIVGDRGYSLNSGAGFGQALGQPGRVGVLDSSDHHLGPDRQDFGRGRRIGDPKSRFRSRLQLLALGRAGAASGGAFDPTAEFSIRPET